MVAERGRLAFAAVGLRPFDTFDGIVADRVLVAQIFEERRQGREAMADGGAFSALRVLSAPISRRSRRRLNPSAELMIDPENGAQCAIRDSGGPRAERYLWTLVVFGSHRLAAGRTGELSNARSQAKAALAGYAAAWREMPRDRSSDHGRQPVGAFLLARFR